jgi:hypothetical protein
MASQDPSPEDFELLRGPDGNPTPSDPASETEGDPVADTPIIARSSVIADGVMTEERLLALIKLDNEEDALDFKRTYDLSKTEDLVKCVKVVVSIANSGGGYIVLGVDEVNEPERRHTVVGCPENHLSQLDPTDIHNKLERFVEEPLDVQLRIHRPMELGGIPVVLIFVPRTQTLPLTFKIRGEYAATDANGKHQRMRTEFRPGEIWVRRGAACIQASARDWRRIRSQIRLAERAKWTEDLLGVTPLVQRMDRVASLLERLLESGAIAGTGSRSAPYRLTAADYLLQPRQLAERIAELIEDES